MIGLVFTQVEPAVGIRQRTGLIIRFWAIHLSGPDENRPLDAVVMAARRTKILRLVRSDEYPLSAYPPEPMDRTRVDDLCAAASPGNPNCPPHGIGARFARALED